MSLPDPCTFASPTFADVTSALPVVLSIIKGSGTDYSTATKVHCLSTAALFGLGMAFPPDKGPFFAEASCPQDCVDLCHDVLAAGGAPVLMEAAGPKTLASINWKTWLAIVLKALEAILNGLG